MGIDTETTVAIMQPYFFPYEGYFQLISVSDVFVLHDNLKYTKKGWINRNQLVDQAGNLRLFSLPLKSDSDYLTIGQRFLADDFDPTKFLRKFSSIYSRAPFFRETMPLLENVMQSPEKNLFHFLENSLVQTVQHIGIEANFVRSSSLEVDSEVKGESRVIEITKTLRGSYYLNPPGGLDLYSATRFETGDLVLRFLLPNGSPIADGKPNAESRASIIHLLMMLGRTEVSRRVNQDFQILSQSDLRRVIT